MAQTERLKLSIHDLDGKSMDQVLTLLERSRIGYQTAMDWLKIDSLTRLQDIMHENGRTMPGHKRMRVPKRTTDFVLSLLRAKAQPKAKSAAASAKRPAARKSTSKTKREV